MLIENIFLETFLKSGLTEMAKVAVNSFVSYWKENDYNFGGEKCEEIISEYLKRSYENNAKMSTIVFRGEGKTLFDLYIPLTISRKSIENEEEICIKEGAIDKISKYKNIMIVDSAGMGKSTIAKYLSVQAVLEKSYIPVIIELRKLSKEKDIWQYLCELFDMIDQGIEFEDIKLLIKSGGFLVIFDGYDEILEPLRVDVIKQIKEFTDKADKNVYILTSREESDLSSFYGFIEFEIKPLCVEEAYSLISKYGNGGKRTKRLIEEIRNEKHNFAVLKEFLVNPMMVSLLYKTYQYKKDLPYKKVEFYRQVYEALYNDHDKSKDAYVRLKKSGLGLREFETVLRYLAFFSMQEWCVEYTSENELLVDVKEAIKCTAGLENVKAEAYIDDLLHAVPVFKKEGSSYRWIHKSFMEYFSAQCIYLDMEPKVKEPLLTKMWKNRKGEIYYNILDFYFDTDYKNFQKCILLPLLREYVKKYQKIKENIENQGFNIDIDMLDLEATTQFFTEYKIICMDNGIKQGTKKKKKYCDGRNVNAVSFGENIVIFLTKINLNISLTKLCFEKDIDIITNIPVEGCMWSRYKELFEDVEYIDRMECLLEKRAEREEIIDLLCFSSFSGNYLCGEKCKKVLKKIQQEVSREEENSKDKFLRLSTD